MRYHGQNETILVNDGFITWQYWLRRVKIVEIKDDQTGVYESTDGASTSNGSINGRNGSGAEQGGEKCKPNLPCRIMIEARGLEWFVYNRSPAYDAILASILRPAARTEELTTTERHGNINQEQLLERSANHFKSQESSADMKLSSSQNTGEDEYGEKMDFSPSEMNRTRSTHTISHGSNTTPHNQSIPLPSYLNFLPIGVTCSHGALVMGNENTSSVLVASFDKANGQISARNSGPLDQYRQCFDFEFVNPVVQLKPNEEYKESQMVAGSISRQRKTSPGSLEHKWHAVLDIRRIKHDVLHSLGMVVPYFRRSVESLCPNNANANGDRVTQELGESVGMHNRWVGLSRYINSSNGDQADQECWKKVEYGSSYTVVDCPKIGLSFFWDVPGRVTASSAVPASLRHGFANDINGSKPPAWGLDLRIGGGTINYGPWADRQRSNLQAIFFPPLHADATVATALTKGQIRVSTVFQIGIEFEDEVTLRIPTREESKDWKWKNHAKSDKDVNNKKHGKKPSARRKTPEKSTLNPEDRPPGWLSVHISRDSCVTYTMDMFATALGFRNMLVVDLKSPEMLTSVNHGTLWRSKTQTICCDLSNPIEWNSLRTWVFDIRSEEFELFILRDHIYLLTDLISDWTGGPPGDFNTFVPFKYSLRLLFPNFKLYLNVNDSNIINDPSDTDDNTFIVVWGRQLTADLSIPLTEYRPLKSKVTFVIDASHGGFQLCTPTWNTQHTLLDSQEVAALKDLRVDGSYHYCTNTAPGLTDTAIINIHGVAPTVHLYGFLIRYFIKLKDNYFGEDLHFQTLEEYQQRINQTGSRGSSALDVDSYKKISNDLDVVVAVTIDNACLMLPANLYSANRNIKISVASILLDLRFTNYYMDLETIFSPLAVSQAIPGDLRTYTAANDSSTQVFVDGIVVSGHRLFGLPPTEPTYVCNWDFDVGHISGESSVEVLSTFLSAIKCLAFTFSDAENALPPFNPLVLHDVTFLRAKVEPIRIWLHVDTTAFLFSTDVIKLDFNDWAGAFFSDRLNLNISRVTLACIDEQSVSRRQARVQSDIVTLAFLESSITIRMVERSVQAELSLRLQQDHVQVHDTRTGRTPWLIHDFHQRSLTSHPEQRTKVRPPAMPYPTMPDPVKLKTDEDTNQKVQKVLGSASDTRRPYASRQSSFLSTNSVPRKSRGLTIPRRRSHSVIEQQPAVPYPPSLVPAVLRSSSIRQFSRQSSVQAVPNLARKTFDGFPSSTVTFSSSYEVPYFPLYAVAPDMRNVPLLPDSIAADSDQAEKKQLDNRTGLVSDDGHAHTTYTVRLNSGIRVFLTPEALRGLNALMKGLQACEPSAILDHVQLKAVTDVQNKKLRPVSMRRTQVRLEVPYTCFRFWDTTPINNTGPAMQPLYNVLATRLVVCGRSSSEYLDGLFSNRQTIHCSLGALSMAAQGEIGGLASDDVRLSFYLDDIALWLVQDDSFAAELQFREFRVTTPNQKVGQLAALFSNTLEVLNELADQLGNTTTLDSDREKFLVHWLATSGTDITDPALLINVSYVLRSDVDHPRNSDTWKMISRLRYVLQHLPADSRRMLSDRLAGPLVGLPKDAVEDVVAYFIHWRSWDLDHVRASSLLIKVYGVPTLNPGERQNATLSHGHLLITAEKILFAVGTGLEVNEVRADNLMVVCAHRKLSPAQQPKTMMDYISVEMFCLGMRASLNWTLFELLEEGLRLMPKVAASKAEAVEHVPDRLSDLKRHGFHITVILENSDITLASINLLASLKSHGLGCSVVMHKNSSQGLAVAVSLSAGKIQSNIQNDSTVLISSKLSDSRVHISLEEEHVVSQQNTNVWKIAALCEELDAQSSEDILDILSVMYIVVRDELAYIQAFLLRLNPQDSQEQEVTASQPAAVYNTIDVLLLLDSFDIGINLLPSLKYLLQGKVARSSMHPLGKGAHGAMIDFDIKTHSHSLVNLAKGTAQEISVLSVPPINGYVKQTTSNTSSRLEVITAVERIHLEASAIQGIMSTLSRSEIDNFRKNVNREIDVLKTSYSNTMAKNNRSSSHSASEMPTLLLNVRLTVNGLSIEGTSGKDTDNMARLRFEIGLIHLEVSNESIVSKQVCSFPEIFFDLRDVKVLLDRVYEMEAFPCGDIDFNVSFHGTTKTNDLGDDFRSYQIKSDGLEINLYTETASTVVDILGHLQEKFKTIDLSEEVRTLRAKRRLRAKSRTLLSRPPEMATVASAEDISIDMFRSMYSLEMSNIRVSWKIGNLAPMSPGHEVEDLVLSITKIDLATKKGNAARLMIENFQLQMVPTSLPKTSRSYNSALLPELVFNVAYISTSRDRRLAFQAAGMSLDLRITSQFILPASDLQRSMALASRSLREVMAGWNAPAQSGGQARKLLGNKKLSSLLIDADFAGAVVYMHGRNVSEHQEGASMLATSRLPQHGRYGQFSHEDSSSTTLRAPGLAWKVEYTDLGIDDPSLNAEIKVDASTNILYPTIVPLILEISSSIKEVVGEPEEILTSTAANPSTSKFMADDKLRTADPSAILGNCRLNLGLRICRQEFSLSCQPIARVAATAQFEDIYITVNTVQSADQRFFAVCAAFTRLQASVQHVYSRESTGSFEVEAVNVSLMNSKHVSNVKGLSAILKMSPMRVVVNAKQLHDFLLFREIWVPIEMRHSKPPVTTLATTESQAFAVQRYQQVAAAGAFPWNATVSVEKLDIRLDLGQALGKSTFSILEFWVSSKKSSDWEQNLCLGFNKMGVDSTGRMSGFIELQNLCLRTSITWEAVQQPKNQTPLIMASLTFDDLRLKVAFDYQPFLVADLLSLEFLMYNVRDSEQFGGDRLVSIVNGDKVQAFCTTTSSAQALALYQAVQRLIQEKQSAYENSLKDIEKYLRRNSTIVPINVHAPARGEQETRKTLAKTPNQLQTNVVVTLKAINIGAFPSTFFDHQVFKLEALDASARFSVTLEQGKVHSGLGLRLGQLRIALSGVTKPSVPKTLGDVTVDEVVESATGSRGGTILKVPRVVATMETWQFPNSNQIDYIFKSSFEGKVEVGWNYSRISYIRGMWSNHSRALAQRLGKPLPQSALQITGGPRPAGEDGDNRSPSGEQEKITAVIHVPQSKYQYTALQSPVIETPQLRDMGEATPPLEWIGLHRERLPILTHQIVIVTLLEVAKEVEDAYSKILGST